MWNMNNLRFPCGDAFVIIFIVRKEQAEFRPKNYVLITRKVVRVPKWACFPRRASIGVVEGVTCRNRRAAWMRSGGTG